MARSGVTRHVRRLMLELWAMIPATLIVGFLGPFDTFGTASFLIRSERWGILLLGAYVLVRPALLFWHWLARVTQLPQRSLSLFGMFLSGLPLAVIWQMIGGESIRPLEGYPSVLPFAILCSLLIMVLAWWAERADAHLSAYYSTDLPTAKISSIDGPAATAGAETISTEGCIIPVQDSRPRLARRLSISFPFPIAALESEDHYVRVHGMTGSELILLRLRDAISEMADVSGEQVHRSWWVARWAVTGLVGSGRNRRIALATGGHAPVARDSIDRLERTGFLPMCNQAAIPPS